MYMCTYTDGGQRKTQYFLLFINVLIIYSINHVVYKMIENNEKCPSQCPKAQGNAFTCHASSDQQSSRREAGTGERVVFLQEKKKFHL